MRKTNILFLFALGLAVGIVGSTLGENRLIAAAGITQGTADGLYVNVTGDTVTGSLAVDGNTTLGDASGDSVTCNAATVTFPNNTTLDASAKNVICKGALWTFAAVTSVVVPNATVGTQAMNRDTCDARYVDLAGDTMTGFLRVGGNLNAEAGFIAESTSTLQGNATMSSARFRANQGADVASADELVLTEGNYFDITGTTTINFISKTNWIAGSTFFLQFDDSMTITHNKGGASGSEAAILLSGSTDYQTTESDILQFVYDGLRFREISRNNNRSPITISFAGGTDPHADTNSATYTTAGIFLFGGTSVLGTPTAIKAIGFKDGAPTSWDFQVLDITNATTIVEKTGSTGVVAEIVDAGALSNLPSGAAMFEVQIKRAGGAGGSEVHIYSLTMEF